MDRKEFLNSLLTVSPKKKITNESLQKDNGLSTTVFLQSGITPYAGSWTKNEIIHLLKRLQFGAPKEEVDFFASLTYDQAVDLLLNTTNTNTGGPLKTYTPDTVTTPRTDPDWAVPMGKTWINVQSTDGSVNANRQASAKAWWMDLMINQPRSIEEKMILFWSTHLTVEFDTVSNGLYIYKYLNTLRTNALGNFKTLIKAISLETSMLVYLNGQYNTKTAPDENYGRELLELFTLGKGPGSQYTEGDVQAAAKVLTGYRITSSTATSYFDSTKHDTTNKQFSNFFGNAVIAGVSGNGGSAELDAMIDMIFTKDEVSKYLCRRLYRFFVYGNISADVETNIIVPMASAMRAANYEVKPALNLLFKSEHFFDVLTQGALIKSPLDFIVGQAREFKLRFPPLSNVILYYKMLGYLIGQASIMDQNMGDPPNVSGWAAYYQDPIYDKVWLNTDTYTKRLSFLTTMISGYTNTNQKIQLDYITLASRMPNPGDPNQLVQDFITYLLRVQLSQATRDNIKSQTLLTGQTTDYYWTNAWTAYLSNPQSPTAFSDVNTRLQNLCKFLINVEEYQLM